MEESSYVLALAQNPRQTEERHEEPVRVGSQWAMI